MESITVILRHGHEKHCLLVLVESFQTRSGRTPRTNRDDLVVYEANLISGRKAFFTVLGKDVELLSGDTIEVNTHYANKLGIKEGEPLPLQKIKSPVLSAVRVSVEPLTSDDWEILERNVGRMETVLLDQVRVVWPGQVLPVWIHKSLFIYLKISEVEPGAHCVILENNTEVVVAPKLRASHPPSSLPLPSKASQQIWSANSPVRNVTEQLTTSAEYDNIDILEPKPTIHSPNKSPRNSINAKRMSNPRVKSLNYGGSSVGIKVSVHQPIVQRQSSLMGSVMRYIFPFRGEKKDIADNLSDSDKGSVMDFSTQELPPRNGVLRVQPMTLSCKMEDSFYFNKREVNNQVRSLFGWRGTYQRTSLDTKLDEHKNYNIPLEIFQPSTVYVDAELTRSERLLHPYLPQLPNNFIARLQRLPSPQEKIGMTARDAKKGKVSGTSGEPAQGEGTEAMEGSIPGSKAWGVSNINGSCYVRVVTIDRKAGLTDDVWQKAADHVLSNQPLLYGHVIIPDLLRRQLRLDATGSVWIQTGPVGLVIPSKVHIHLLTSIPRTVGNDLIIMAFRNYIRLCANMDHPLVVFQGIFLRFMVFPDIHAEVQLTFFGENDISSVKAVTMLSDLNIDNIHLVLVRDAQDDKLGVVNSLLAYTQVSDFDVAPFPQKLKHLGGIENLAQQAMLYLHASLASRPLSRHCFQVRGGLYHGILLITGPKGAGKSSLVKGLCRKVAHLPVFAHVTLIDCKTLRGKTVAMIQKMLEMAFDEAAWREPAVVVLENLDVIVPAPSGPETEMSGESLYSAKNAQVLEGLIRYEIENNSRVMVIATSTSRSSLHPSLVSSRGVHCIQQTLNIGSPDKEAREKILQSILERNNCVSKETLKILDLSAVAVKTEGYVARDLELLVNRTIHARISIDIYANENRFILKTEDFEETLSTFKPVSMRNIPLHKAGDLGWDDVGGLSSVKTALIETLRWPSKYPQLFSSCPLRLKSGIMLYGAPGTGKTLLAGVVARECGLNFISIKGPELLNKYIGASEQAVRDLFVKAQSAKPCILFFDEFDSIAPRRGHDSTGVTDRVVNQLLTQLDGVEGLQGVYVLAATSRPDLIDPALLRPGRLDICLNCAMPDQTDRFNILSALTRRMSLCFDVDLKEVAASCGHFTGADLKALLYNAQLSAIHEETDNERNLNESVVFIKGDNSQYNPKRRASIVKNEAGAYMVNLSKSISTSSSWDRSSGTEDLLSPKLKNDSPGNRTPKSVQMLKAECCVIDENEFDGSDPSQMFRKGRWDEEGIFHFPDCSEGKGGWDVPDDEQGGGFGVVDSEPAGDGLMSTGVVAVNSGVSVPVDGDLVPAGVSEPVGGDMVPAGVSVPSDDGVVSTSVASEITGVLMALGDVLVSKGVVTEPSGVSVPSNRDQKSTGASVPSDDDRKSTGASVPSEEGFVLSDGNQDSTGGEMASPGQSLPTSEDQDSTVVSSLPVGDGDHPPLPHHDSVPEIEDQMDSITSFSSNHASLLMSSPAKPSKKSSWKSAKHSPGKHCNSDLQNNCDATEDPRPGAQGYTGPVMHTKGICEKRTDDTTKVTGFKPSVDSTDSVLNDLYQQSSAVVQSSDFSAGLTQDNDTTTSDQNYSHLLKKSKQFNLQQNTKSRRRRRAYAQETEMMSNVSERDAPPDLDDLMSPSMEKPVTVFTSLERGLATLSSEDETKYLAMVKELQRWDENFFEVGKHRDSTQLDMKPPSVLIEVCQRHLLEAAKSLRPSVSAAEREKYIRIYDNFVSSRTAGFEKAEQTPVGKRATLA